MKPGTIALARVQQADGQLKLRPVVVLCTMPPFDDFLVCAVSSKLKQECVDFDEVLAMAEADFAMSGLKVSSLIRLGLLATIPKTATIGCLGKISDERLRRLLSRLASWLNM